MANNFFNQGMKKEWPQAADVCGASRDHSGMRNGARELQGTASVATPENEEDLAHGSGAQDNGEENLATGSGQEFNSEHARGVASGSDVGTETSRGGKRVGDKNTTR